MLHPSPFHYSAAPQKIGRWLDPSTHKNMKVSKRYSKMPRLQQFLQADQWGKYSRLSTNNSPLSGIYRKASNKRPGRLFISRGPRGGAYLKGALILNPPKTLPQISFFLMKNNPKWSKNDLKTCFPHQKLSKMIKIRSQNIFYGVKSAFWGIYTWK